MDGTRPNPLPLKPTLDEMGPHAMLPPKGGTPPQRPARTIDVPTEAEKKSRRPGQ